MSQFVHNFSNQFKSLRHAFIKGLSSYLLGACIMVGLSIVGQVRGFALTTGQPLYIYLSIAIHSLLSN